MSWLSNLLFRLQSLSNKRRMDTELDEELRFCLDLETEAKLRLGMSPDEARRAARLKIGGTEQIKEVCRDERGFPFLESSLQDVFYGLRSLLRAPTLTLVAILVLALGIGAVTAMFSVVKAVLLDPLPYPDAGRLVHIHSKGRYPSMGLSLPNLEDVKAQQTSFVDLAGYQGYAEVNLTGGTTPLRARVSRVMPGFFDVVDVHPLIGHSFHHASGKPVTEKSVLLSHSTWKSVFGGDADIVGRVIELDDEDYNVFGVMPAGFVFPGGKDVWIPWDVEAETWANQRDAHRLNVIARVSADKTIEEARTELNVIFRRLAEEHTEIEDLTGFELVPEFETHRGKARTPLLVLMGAVVLVLLVVSVNLAGLLLSRGMERQRELVLRSALGASRFRITRQLLTETLLLCIPGCCLGLVLAQAGIRLLTTSFPAESFTYLYMGGIPRLDEARMGPMVFGFAVAISVSAALASGLFPALRLSKPGCQNGLRDGNRLVTTPLSRTRARNLLAISQLALSFSLVVGAALLNRSYLNVVSVDLGFKTEDRITAQTVLSRERYTTHEAKIDYWKETVNRLQTIPGTLEIATTSNLPFSNWGFGTRVIVEGRPTDEQSAPGAEWFSVSSNYLEVMGIDVLQGRSFGAADSRDAEPVMLIDLTLEALLFPEGGALGKQISLSLPHWEMGKPIVHADERRTIVGVVEGIRRNGPLRQAGPTIYIPYHQHPTDRLTFVLRTAVAPESLAGPLRENLETIDPDQPIYHVETLEDYFRFSISQNRLSNVLMTFFGLSALTLACLGLYGLLAFRVAQRTHEIGIRRALGAGRRDIFGMIVGRGMVIIAVGLALGGLAAFGLTQFLSSMLFGVSATDEATFIAVSAVFFSVGFVACALPALRAVRVDPIDALRHE